MKSKLSKLKFAIFGFLVLLLALSPVTSVVAQGLGHGFYGTVKIDGEDAEIDTVISAQVGVTEYSSCRVETLGQYALIVQGEIEDGATINFYVNGQEADQTFPFHDGWTTQLDLTAPEAEAEPEPEPEPEIAPTVVTNAASAITRTSATLNGNLTSLGTASSVDVSFEWGTSTAYGNETPAVSINQIGVFSAALSGLSSDTTYHFRAKAVGDGPPAYGADRSFTTRRVAVGGGGGGLPPPPAGTTDVSGMVTSAGRFTRSVTATSEDELCTLTIPSGTVGLTKELEPLDEITIVIMDEPPDPPEDANIVGLAYDFGPDGATFDPPITLEYTYDPDDIPEGVAEEDLVIAMWDEEAGEWVELPCTVDPVTHTITASVSHFTTFAIIARLPVAPPPTPAPTPAPAAFSLSNLSIQPAEVQPKEAVTITLSVANTGGTEGSYSVVLKINGVKEAEKRVTVAAGKSQDVSFSVAKEKVGSYSVVVDGLTTSFTVAAPPAAPAPVPTVPPEVEVPINWTLLGGIIGIVVAAVLLIFILMRRRAH